MEFVIKTLRTLFFSLDKVIYGLIDDVYGLLLQLSRTSVFSQDAIHQFAERVYALVGIFMLFKVTVSLINYVLNPDDFTDKDKGFGSIIKHVVLSLVMVVLVPYIFNEAFELQSIILEENTIMNLVFGSPSDRDIGVANSTYTETAGQKIQFTIMYAFAQPNYDDFFNDSQYDLIDCRNTYQENADGNYEFRQLPTFNNVESKKSNFIYALNESCWGVYDPATDTYMEDGEKGQLAGLFKSVDSDVAYQNYAQGVAQQSFNMFFRQDVILAKEATGSRYFVDYKMGLSTAVGVGVLYLLLMFCIDIAIRSVKLGFLQMIAPIPILSYCDPKSGKDGMFKKWTKMCFNTYLDLFIRLFALYFGIYVITLIGTFRDVITGEVVSGWFVSIFMIIGILIFVKKLPDILKESLGLEGGTFKDFKLNPLKRIEEDALGGKRITGAVAGGLAGISSGNFIGGLAHGAFAGKGFRDAWKDQAGYNAKLRDARRNGSTLFGRLGNNISSTLGLTTQAERLEGRTKGIDEQIKAIDNRIKPTKDSIEDRKAYANKVKSIEDRAVDKIKNGEAGKISENYNTLLNRAEVLREQLRTGVAGVTEQHVAQASMDAQDYLNNMGKEDYINNVIGASTGAREFNGTNSNLAADSTYRQSDAAMTGSYNDLIAMTATAQTYTHDSGTVTVDRNSIANATTMHSISGQVNGSITYDTRNIINPAEGEKQSLEREKADIYDQQHRASANNVRR